MSNELWKLEANQIIDLLRKTEISTSEVVQASINRIEEVDDKVNAIPIRCFDRAIKKAKNININVEKRIQKVSLEFQ